MVVETTKKHSSQAMIIPILILSYKIVMSLSHRDSTLWSIYITIQNLDRKYGNLKNGQKYYF